MNDHIRAGDTIIYVGGASRTLAIDTGDIGVVVRGSTDWARESVSVHFRKWDDQGGSQHPAGAETHHVDGIEAFYIGVHELKKHMCMFKEV